ncbi:MAG: acetate kinase [Desulfovibrionales bacterium GWA2_65_9]|nr:MAG: acetate kinase [Desulfovibrionales bacterium GWA2_65_9]
MNILVINTGSSSLKYQLFDMAGPTVLASGLVERIGESRAKLMHKKRPGQDGEGALTREEAMPDHGAAMRAVITLLTDPEHGVIKDTSEINAVGHRVVHGGEHFHASTLVDADVMDAIRACVPLAPLHNPANLIGLETAQALFPGVPQVAVFDTAFHQTMPPKAYLYALPYELYTELNVRRYGFHGTSHRFVAGEAARMLGKAPEDTNLITVHLGNGSSICAVKGGKSVDTSLGMTPLAGVIMGTRSGDIDPAIIFYLAERKGYSLGEIDDILNKKSGLKGICGMNDMRDIHKAVAEGDVQARLALDMFGYRNRKYIGSYMAVLGRVDAIVFTAGIGENDPVSRELSCRGLTALGVELDHERNQSPERGARDIGAAGSQVRVMVIPTNEELEIARQTGEVLRAR